MSATAAVREVWAVRNFTWAQAHLTFNRIYNACKVGHWMCVHFPHPLYYRKQKCVSKIVQNDKKLGQLFSSNVAHSDGGGGKRTKTLFRRVAFDECHRAPPALRSAGALSHTDTASACNQQVHTNMLLTSIHFSGENTLKVKCFTTQPDRMNAILLTSSPATASCPVWQPSQRHGRMHAGILMCSHT